MSKMDKVVGATKGPESHVSFYVFEKTRKELEEFGAKLPKEFYVEDEPGSGDNDWITFKADNFAGFEYVEITAYLVEAP